MLCLLSTYIAYFLFACLLHIPAYLVMHVAAYFEHISAYLNLHIMAYLPSCIFKHITHISAYKMHIYAYFRLIMHIYCIFLICIFVHISCIFGTAYFVHISAYFNLHIMAYLPLCIFKLISAYLPLLCLPRPISFINIQTAVGAQRERCFFCRLNLPIFLSFNSPYTPLKSRRGSLPIKDLRKKPKLNLALTAGVRSGVNVLETSSCLFSSFNLDNWYWDHGPRPATLKTRCIRQCIRLFVVESTQEWLWSVQMGQ